MNCIAIGVYTTEETLEEKKKHAADPDKIVWWNLGSKPLRGDPERIFFATGGKWKGYFTVKKVIDNTDGPGRAHPPYSVFLGEWHELDEKPDRSAFQGFTYAVPVKA